MLTLYVRYTIKARNKITIDAAALKVFMGGITLPNFESSGVALFCKITGGGLLLVPLVVYITQSQCCDLFL